ncbi:hypothetical protein CHS0354_042276 [Potamilus streckersoni]|uniref:Uncharacterized protein n=1 Tax=Potamilus streckersoni TaxID=2493646 RepID=A0AAE0SU19_9BIVA|nr:hypothetical protein CHS0354_042276 [Potamilus streckersoni]
MCFTCDSPLFAGTVTNTQGGGGGGSIPFGILPGSSASSGGGSAGTGSVGPAGAAINPLGIPSGPGFNIGSNTGGGGGQGITAGGSGSGSNALIGTSNGGVFQSFVCSSTSVLNSCPTDCIEVDAQNGCPSCRSSCPSATGGSIQLGSATINTSPTSCPPYPSNCPQIYSKMQNGCHVCTILQQIHTVQHTTTAVPIIHATCAPVKCLAPCNVGIIIKADGCPACKCPDHV